MTTTQDRDLLSELGEATAGLRVALVHDWLNGMRGGEKVLEHVCELFPDADLYTLFCEPENLSPTLRRMNIIEGAWAKRFPALRRYYRQLLPALPKYVRTLPTAEYDVVISTSHCVAKGAPAPTRGMHLSYVFSPMRYVWDHFEDYLGGGMVRDTALRLVRGRLQDWDWATAQDIDSVAADSAHIAGKIERFWGRRARVIHPPVDLDFFTPGEEPSGDAWLVVSALVPYKHVERAIRAVQLAGHRLVVIGSGPERPRLEAESGAETTFLGWASAEDLRAAYRRCKALLYPGTEDFGITALEAQACGRPVLALRRGGAVETVTEGETGAFFDQPTAEDLADLLTKFEAQSYNSNHIRRWAETFSPERFRRELAGWVLEEGEFKCW